MDLDGVVLNGCAFIASVYLLQRGASLFTNNVAIVAQRCGAPGTLVALLTIGAEWEELAVVVASIVQRRPSLGLGSVVGCCVSNVMGVLALGILFNADPIRFDLGAKIYSGALFAVSTIFTLLAFTQQLDLTGGIFFIVGFAVYVFSICSAIYDGILDPEPEDVEELAADSPMVSHTPTEHQQLHVAIFPSVLQCHPNEASALLPVSEDYFPPVAPAQPLEPATTSVHALLALVGLVALCIAAYVLAHAAGALAACFHISNTLIGVTLVAVSTTIPEKIVSIYSTWQRRTTIMTATTAGSNIFLLTLCVGIIFVTRQGSGDADEGGPKAGNGLQTDSLGAFEVWSVWGCSLILVLTTWFGARRWLGAFLFGLYVGFLGTEITFLRDR
ncbi:hypothetical protein MBM_09512 [Drepanopeziza brunnea f. sp. 'multigermtubi' MB_m1]|uniref:Sodium/calcium exchanger membrane region domain-containing protein n=1 Tax=Marssonina brunnea f. sp. multigermtubi (strain MB_m1) TaxID=1072389 RepID=K1WJE4_MARBU|nr:uncharacterized protein MBM_09512 [Drepanopeziza brunnea f. sp. 'multigermtubi' MB_m1]EKD12337.1 hypothetical protein MBM_09512 [Drepanopeziza brunnea f. sp. 'multigermtubi' MB_m1]